METIATQSFSKPSQGVLSNLDSIPNLGLIKERAGFIRRKVLEHLDTYLTDWDTFSRKNQIKTFWNNTSDGCIDNLRAYIKKKEITNIYGIAQDLSNEVDLINKLGADSFALQNPKDSSNPSKETSVLIIEADYLLSDNGGIIILDKDGAHINALSKFHNIIILVSIERILQSFAYLDIILPLYQLYKYGKAEMPQFVLIEGNEHHPKIPPLKDITVMMIDNGRSELLGYKPQGSALACIRCGACSAICPIEPFNNQKSYTAFSGPIGRVVNPFIGDWNKHIEQSFSTPLCGACDDICPVQIKLSDLMLANRQVEVKTGNTNKIDDASWLLWKKAMLKRSTLNTSLSILKNHFFTLQFGKHWSKYHTPPQYAKKPFHEQWKNNKP